MTPPKIFLFLVVGALICLTFFYLVTRGGRQVRVFQAGAISQGSYDYDLWWGGLIAPAWGSPHESPPKEKMRAPMGGSRQKKE